MCAQKTQTFSEALDDSLIADELNNMQKDMFVPNLGQDVKEIKKPKIGSIKQGQINFPKTAQVFDDKDKSEKIKSLVKQTKVFKDPNTMGVKKRD